MARRIFFEFSPYVASCSLLLRVNVTIEDVGLSTISPIVLFDELIFE
jgi:hypothetical protein